MSRSADCAAGCASAFATGGISGPRRAARPYDLFASADPSVVALQLDTGNAAVGGKDPLEFMQRYASRYSLFHIKDAPSIGAANDTELGKGVINFRRILGMIDGIDNKHLYVEQETYPGAPMKRAQDYIHHVWSSESGVACDQG